MVLQTGPETGSHFWTGYTNDGSGPGTGDGAVVNGGYANWAQDHLNVWANGMDEDFGIMSLKSDSANYYPARMWQDSQPDYEGGFRFVVEYGGQEVPTGELVAYVDGAEGVFGTASWRYRSTGDAGRNILHGGDGTRLSAGGAGQDLISGGAGADIVTVVAGEDILD